MNIFSWFQGILSLRGMPDAQGKPILLCSCNDNTVRLYELPSWVIWMMLIPYPLLCPCILIFHPLCILLMRVSDFIDVASLIEGGHLQSKKSERLRLDLVAFSSLVMGQVGCLCGDSLAIWVHCLISDKSGWNAVWLWYASLRGALFSQLCNVKTLLA